MKEKKEEERIMTPLGKVLPKMGSAGCPRKLMNN